MPAKNVGCVGTMTRVVLLSVALPYGFFLFRLRNSSIMRSPLLRRLRRLAIWATLDLVLFAGALAFSTSADTSGRLRKPSAAGCYCNCAQSKTGAGCTKMCELPKYSSRWWAVSCAKPRAQAPAENPGAGPHYPRRPRAERASN